jgi:hypothetical protein
MLSIGMLEVTERPFCFRKGFVQSDNKCFQQIEKISEVVLEFKLALITLSASVD